MFQPSFSQYHLTGNIIAASAGTGKTYQLASRYIALLVLGAKPEEIIALTFTRKAAGEFRNRILHALAEGACNKKEPETGRNALTVRVWDVLSGYSTDSEGKAVPASNPVPLLPATASLIKLAEEHSTPGHICYPEELYTADKSLQEYYGFAIPNAATFAKLLSKMVAVMSRLKLTTIDSFFTSLVTTNSLELGMNNAEPLDPTAETKAQTAAVQEYLETLGAQEATRQEFLRMFRNLTEGVGNKTQSKIEKELNNFLSLYRSLPVDTQWGNVAAFVDDATLHVATDAEMQQYRQTAVRLQTLLYQHGKNWLENTVFDQFLAVTNGELQLGKTAAKWLSHLPLHRHLLPELDAIIHAFDTHAPITQELENAYQACSEAPQLYGWTKKIQNGLETMFKKLCEGKKWNDTQNTSALRSEVEKLHKLSQQKDILLQIKNNTQTLLNLAKACRLRRIADKTAALHTLLQGYSTCYDKRMQAEGKLSFADVARLAKTLMHTATADANQLRHHVAYRMGAELHHWMLDEFQDTSEDQFATLEPLLSPIAEDAGANGIDFSTPEWQQQAPAALQNKLQSKEYHVAPDSLFVVGDVKQSIYGFRTGKTEVFDRLHRDRIWKTALEPSELIRSFRSSPVIMGEDGFINRLFRALHRIECPLTGTIGCIDAYPVTHLEQFTTHRAAKNKAGYVEVSVVPTPGNNATDNEDDRNLKTRLFDAVTHILQRLTVDNRPRNGISIAILVRSNTEADEIMAHLTATMPDLPTLLVKDTLAAAACPLGEILLYFFRWLLHPCDAAALGVTKASFWGKLFLQPAEQVHKQWLGDLHSQGYAHVLTKLTALLPEQERTENAALLTLWLNNALAADTAGTTLAEWVHRMKHLCIQGVSNAAAVQIMTMHKSKGLEFDAVILPYCSKNAVDSTKELNYFLSADGRSILLSPGSKEEWPLFGSAFTSLAQQWQKEQRKEAYNLLYVATTRAKHANYIICHGAPLCKDTPAAEHPSDIWHATARSASGLIRQAIAYYKNKPEYLAGFTENQVIYTQGSETWYTEAAKAEAPAPITPNAGFLCPGAAIPRRTCITPSSLCQHEDNSFAEPEGTPEPVKSGAGGGTDLGTKVHKYFEEIFSLTELPDWVASPQNKAQQIVAAALQQPDVAALLTSSPQTEVFNEQGIVAGMANNQWVSGSIDRLMLTSDASGTVRAAHIIDYKTNKLVPTQQEKDVYKVLLQRYTAQMTAYKQLVADAFGLPATDVTVSLVSCPKDYLRHPAKVLTYPNEMLPIKA